MTLYSAPSFIEASRFLSTVDVSTGAADYTSKAGPQTTLADSAVHRYDVTHSMFDPKTSPFVVIDVETTGLLPVEDRVVEVGAIRLVGGREDGRFHSMIQPGRPMPEAARSKNGIS